MIIEKYGAKVNTAKEALDELRSGRSGFGLTSIAPHIELPEGWGIVDKSEDHVVIEGDMALYPSNGFKPIEKRDIDCAISNYVCIIRNVSEEIATIKKKQDKQVSQNKQAPIERLNKQDFLSSLNDIIGG